VLAIVLACLFAAWLPATRAARLDPMQGDQAGLTTC
jgi:ABC-type lipoprotein release transport system permease subunit